MTTTTPAPAGSSGDTGAGRAAIAARTLRTDRWWFPPAIQAAGLMAWVAYAVSRTAMKERLLGRAVPLPDAVLLAVHVRRRASPRPRTSAQFMPRLSGSSRPTPCSSLPFLLLFRLTCYYYRKAYYRAFWLSPPACAVAEPHQKYTGETRFPLLGQNLHRYFFYAAVHHLVDQHLRRDPARSAPPTVSSGSGSATSSCSSTSSCCGPTPRRATPAAASSAASSTTSPSTRSATGRGASSRS